MQKAIIFLMLLLTTQTYASTHHEINTIKEVKGFVPTKGKTLVVFDIDATLTYMNEPAFQYDIIGAHKLAFRKLIKESGLSLGELATYVALTHEYGLLDKSSPSIFNQLKDLDCDIIAITAAELLLGNDLFGFIPRTRLERLEAMGLFFDNISPCFPQEFKFPAGELVGHYKGLFCAGSVPKSQLLFKVLDLSKNKYDTIVFVDDRANNVKEMLSNEALPGKVIGLHFQGKPYCINDKGEMALINFSSTEKEFIETWKRCIEATKEILERIKQKEEGASI